MKRTFSVVVSSALLGALIGCSKSEPPRPTEADLVKRGEYLVNAGDCAACHTPKVFTQSGPEPDKTRLYSGHPANAKLPPVPSGVLGPNGWGAITNNDLTAWVGPWGTSFAANLTPDASGLKSWTPETFIQALRTGKHAGVGRAILPPMPWTAYAQMSDDDLRAMFAYFKSLPPVANTVPEPVPPPGNQATGKK